MPTSSPFLLDLTWFLPPLRLRTLQSASMDAECACANLKSGYIHVLSTGGMVETKVLENQEYVTLIPSISTTDYERLKKSIAEEDGLLMPVILNQDNVVLDGHHRMRACKEFGFTATYNVKDFIYTPPLVRSFIHGRNAVNIRDADVIMIIPGV
jgi:hypothetical protein